MNEAGSNIDGAVLWPPPQRVEVTSGGWRPGSSAWLRVVSPWPGHADVVEILLAGLMAHGIVIGRRDAGPAAVVLAVDPGLGLAGGGYRLEVGESGVEIVGVDARGVRHGVMTLLQWAAASVAHSRSRGEEEPAFGGLAVRDWPDLPRRGLMLDVSRDRVPTMATLRQLIAHLAALKLDQLQLYMEHTFAYAGHEVVWQDASPFSPDEIRELDACCRRHGIELVANQNSLGHLHRWLRLPEYRRYAECPDGVSHPFSDDIEPFSLCPTDPAALVLLADWYDQLLPCFASDQVNAGLDETFDLGLGRSAAAVAERGRARVYLEHLQAVHRLLAERGRRLQVWGDIVLEHPELIPELPRDLTALVWGYERNHPFAAQAAQFAAAGISYYLCPGTSSWSSFAGRSETALRNLAAAARVGREHGAAGLLITDWGDFGHLQPPSVSWAPLVAGAGWAWNAGAAPEETEPLDLGVVARAVNVVVFAQPDAGLARAALALGSVYRRTGTPNVNGTALFHLLIRAGQDLTHGRYRGLTDAGLAQVRGAVEELLALLAVMPVVGEEAALSRDELVWVGELLLLAADLGRVRLAAGATVAVAALPAAERRRLRAALEPLVRRHGELWLRRSRPGGRRDSVARLCRLAELLESP